MHPLGETPHVSSRDKLILHTNLCMAHEVDHFLHVLKESSIDERFVSKELLKAYRSLFELTIVSKVLQNRDVLPLHLDL